MTQIEFENELRELRCQKGAAISAIAMMQGEVKEEISAIDRQIKDLRTRREKLNQQRIVLGNQRFAIEKEWGEKIQAYINQYQEQAERSWDAVSTYTIVKELRKRGWQGTIFNNDPDMAEEHKDGVIAAFNGKAKEEESEE